MQFIDLWDSEMPVLGFGTWQLRGDECVKGVMHALDVGYRHIDTAQVYENEAQVGDAMARSSTQRDRVFLTTKVWRDNFEGKDKALASIEESLKKLKTDYVDLLLVHWPFPEHDIGKMLEPLLAAQEKGMTRQIGVSNFTRTQMDAAREFSAGKVCVNQVEYHPGLNQKPVLEYIQEHGMCLTAYSPLGRGKNLDEPVLKEIAEAHGKSAAQVCLRWLVQQSRVAAIPKSATPKNIESNFDIFDFELNAEEMQKIFTLAREDGRLVSPDWAPQWDTATVKKAA
jgi:diketogulonate reductase-like aldo/keto reductase